MSAAIPPQLLIQVKAKIEEVNKAVVKRFAEIQTLLLNKSNVKAIGENLDQFNKLLIKQKMREKSLKKQRYLINMRLRVLRLSSKKSLMH